MIKKLYKLKEKEKFKVKYLHAYLYFDFIAKISFLFENLIFFCLLVYIYKHFLHYVKN